RTHQLVGGQQGQLAADLHGRGGTWHPRGGEGRGALPPLLAGAERRHVENGVVVRDSGGQLVADLHSRLSRYAEYRRVAAARTEQSRALNNGVCHGHHSPEGDQSLGNRSLPGRGGTT